MCFFAWVIIVLKNKFYGKIADNITERNLLCVNVQMVLAKTNKRKGQQFPLTVSFPLTDYTGTCNLSMIHAAIPSTIRLFVFW